MSNHDWEALLEKYKRGTISMDERFLLEKKALDDPFLFDALEGFTIMQGEKKKNRKTLLSWLPLTAASLVGAIAISAVFYFSNSTTPNSEKYAHVIEEQEVGSNNNTSVVSRHDDEQQQHAEVAATGKVEARNKKDPSAKASNAKTNEAPQSQILKEGDNTVVAVVEDIQEDVAFEGEMVDNGKSSSQEAVVSVESGEPITVNDAEIVSIPTKAKIATKSEEEKEQYAYGEPLIGKAQFDEFIQEKIKERGLQQTPPMIISVEFSLDNNGMSTSYRHISDICLECNAFAIYLLQNSGEWKKPLSYTGEVLRYDFKF